VTTATDIAPRSHDEAIALVDQLRAERLAARGNLSKQVIVRKRIQIIGDLLRLRRAAVPLQLRYARERVECERDMGDTLLAEGDRRKPGSGKGRGKPKSSNMTSVLHGGTVHPLPPGLTKQFAGACRTLAQWPKEHYDAALSRCIAEPDKHELTSHALVSLALRWARTQATTDAPVFPAGTFAVLSADPPWAYDNSGFKQSAAGHYPTLETPAICDLADANGRPVAELATDASVLFLWVTSPLLPDGLRVLDAWKFSYVASLVWVKDRAPGLGWWVETRHEFLLIGRRADSPQPAIKPLSVIDAPVGGHSEKPVIVAETIEAMFPGPLDETHYIELFSRAPRAGWAAFGNQVRV